MPVHAKQRRLDPLRRDLTIICGIAGLGLVACLIALVQVTT